MLLTPLAMHAARSRPASERITIGMIGIGAMGRPHLDRLLGFEDVQVVAVCDVEKTRRETARAQVEKRYAARQKDGVFKGCDAYTDFRELIARKDIVEALDQGRTRLGLRLKLSAAQRDALAADPGERFDVVLIDSTDPVDAAVELFTDAFYAHEKDSVF